MAKVAVPVARLNYDSSDTFNSDIVETFEEIGIWNPVEDYTFTGRVTVPNERRVQVAESIRAQCDSEEAERLITLLETNDWDVSFFVDSW